MADTTDSGDDASMLSEESSECHLYLPPLPRSSDGDQSCSDCETEVMNVPVWEYVEIEPDDIKDFKTRSDLPEGHQWSRMGSENHLRCVNNEPMFLNITGFNRSAWKFLYVQDLEVGGWSMKVYEHVRGALMHVLARQVPEAHLVLDWNVIFDHTPGSVKAVVQFTYATTSDPLKLIMVDDRTQAKRIWFYIHRLKDILVRANMISAQTTVRWVKPLPGNAIFPMLED